MIAAAIELATATHRSGGGKGGDHCDRVSAVIGHCDRIAAAAPVSTTVFSMFSFTGVKLWLKLPSQVCCPGILVITSLAAVL